MIKIKSTTVCAVLKDGKVTIGADGQATMGNTVAKSNVNKIRVLLDGKILAVVITDSPLSDEEWNKVDATAEWFSKKGEDESSLYNFWEATNGIGSIDIEN